jgi:hypothetical protein
MYNWIYDRAGAGAIIAEATGHFRSGTFFQDRLKQQGIATNFKALPKDFWVWWVGPRIFGQGFDF